MELLQITTLTNEDYKIKSLKGGDNMFQENQTISIVLQTAISQYLDYIASYPEKIDRTIQQRARIGADILAATTQYSQSALNCFDDLETEPQPLSVFALIRSTIYGFQYLDSLEEIQKEEPHTSVNRVIERSTAAYMKSTLVKELGPIHSSIDNREQWSKLSSFVHIIPAIDKNGGAHFNRVKFSFPRDLSKPSIHAGLPERFTVEAKNCLDWQAKICIGFFLKFRDIYPYFFEFRSTIVTNHFSEYVFSEFRNYLLNLPSGDNTKKSVKFLAQLIFADPKLN